MKTKLGIEIEELLRRGHLVSDDIVIDMVKERLEGNQRGYILDGFPRTINQAKALDHFVSDMDRVIKVTVADDIIVERMSGRKVCVQCGATYHIQYHPPQREALCDKCGGKLVQRDDDKAKTVLDRLKIYHELTEPIVDFYKEKGILFEVSGIGEVNDITERIIEQLNRSQ